MFGGNTTPEQFTTQHGLALLVFHWEYHGITNATNHSRQHDSVKNHWSLDPVAESILCKFNIFLTSESANIPKCVS